jgi:hypothetical protein
MAKKINKKQVDAVFGSGNSMIFDSTNKIINHNLETVMPNLTDNLELAEFEDPTNKVLFMYYTSQNTDGSNVQSLSLVNKTTGVEYPCEFRKVHTYLCNDQYLKYKHIFEVTKGFENMVIGNKYELKILGAPNSNMYLMTLVELLKYPKNSYHNGLYFSVEDRDEDFVTRYSFALSGFERSTKEIKVPKTQFAKVFNTSQQLTEEMAGSVLVCTNDSDISLDFSALKDNSLLSVVKLGAGNVTFTTTKGTVFGGATLSGAKGSSASIIVMPTELIVNLNSK